MSHAATTWAFAQKIESSTKFVLVALADYANKKWLAWPSVAALEEKTCLKRRAILYALADLKKAGFIESLDERKGDTKQIPVYQLKGCTTCTVTSTERVHQMHGKGAPRALVRVHHVHTEPSVGTVRTVNKKKNHFIPENATLPFASEKFQAAWCDWCKLRAEIHKPLTPTAVKQQLIKCEQWGEDRSLAALEISTSSSWTGLFEPKGNNSKPNHDPENYRNYVG